MATNLSDLKKNRAALFSKVSKELEEKSNSKEEDKRFWRLERDKTGNAQAVIRFLPPIAEGDELPWVRMFSHAFKGPTGKWYINNSLSTIGQPDPCGEYNKSLWDSGDEAKKEQVRKQKRKTTFIANILVIRDPAHPENEGTVRLYKFGKKIFEMIQSKAKPEFEDEAPVFVYDLWEGANFRLKIKTVSDFPNYDASLFDAPSELFEGDEKKLQKVLDSVHPLNAFHAADQFKSYADLKKDLDRALGLAGGPVPRAAVDSMDEDEGMGDPEPIKAKVKPVVKKVVDEAESLGDSDDSDMDYFKNLLKD